MSYQIPDARIPAIRAATDALEGAREVILTTHINADGDGVGSQAALLSFLLERGVEAWIVNPTPFPEFLRFLVPEPSKILDATGEVARLRCGAADLCVVVDTGEKSRIARVHPLVRHVPKLVIDHHPVAEDAIEGISFRDPGAAAAGELVFDLLWNAEGPWTRSAVDGLYVALMTDTGSFRFSNVTPGVHRVVAELLERGASPESLHREIYGRVPIRRIRLLQEVLPSVDVSSDGRVAWISVPEQTLRDLQCTSEDLEGLVDYPRELEGVDVGILFRELAEGQVKISLRSNGRVDVNRLARSFGGGGHVRAAGALLSGSLDEVREQVVSRTVAAVAE